LALRLAAQTSATVVNASQLGVINVLGSTPTSPSASKMP
jgi:hypothetical protein